MADTTAKILLEKKKGGTAGGIGVKTREGILADAFDCNIAIIT